MNLFFGFIQSLFYYPFLFFILYLVVLVPKAEVTDVTDGTAESLSKWMMRKKT
jgi:hypothetical protein